MDGIFFSFRGRSKVTGKSILIVGLAGAFFTSNLTAAQQFQNKAEYDAYMALYNEEDLAARVTLGEDFVSTYPESEAAPIAYQLLVATHYAQRDWPSVLDVAKQFDRVFPDADNDTKSFIYSRAMAAAGQQQAPLDILDFGDKVLELDRNNLGALLTLPPVILDNIPAFGSARENNLARAFELANRARVRAQSAYPISGGNAQQAGERAQVFSRVHLYIGQVHELRGDDQRAITEFARILEYDSSNSDAYLRLGLAYQRQAAAQSTLLTEAIGNGGPEIETDPPGELDPESSALQEAALQNLELAIDYLASAAALGGQAANLARTELESIYNTREPAQWELTCETNPDGPLCRLASEDAAVDAGQIVIGQLIGERRDELDRAQ